MLHFAYSLFLLLAVANLFPRGVPGGVLEGELLLSGCGRGGIHRIQRLLGLGPKFIPPQAVHGGFGGGDHGDNKPLLGGGESRDAGVVGGGKGCNVRGEELNLGLSIIFLNEKIAFTAVQSTLRAAI